MLSGGVVGFAWVKGEIIEFPRLSGMMAHDFFAVGTDGLHELAIGLLPFPVEISMTGPMRIARPLQCIQHRYTVTIRRQILAVPLFLLKVELTPAEITWLPALFFVIFGFPARLLKAGPWGMRSIANH